MRPLDRCLRLTSCFALEEIHAAPAGELTGALF